jgi:hypothetical protein
VAHGRIVAGRAARPQEKTKMEDGGWKMAEGGVAGARGAG